MNAEAPDLVLLGGDFTDAHPLWGRRLAPERIAERLAELEAPLGRVAVLGNHDWRAFGMRMWTALAAAGIPVLENDALAFDAPGGRLHVAGLADVRFRRPDLARALATVPDGEPAIVLAHDPDVFPFVPARVALTVSGHTHGGQVAIPVLRLPFMPSRHGERYARGHIVEHGRHLVVGTGLGTSGIPYACSPRPSCWCSSCAGDDDVRRLLTIPISHFCEKARWALERAGSPTARSATSRASTGSCPGAPAGTARCRC